MDKIKHLIYWLLRAKSSGLLPLKEDHRDYQVSELGFGRFGYQPKHTEKYIETVSVKNQRMINTCQWCATTIAKEVDEQKKLSVRSIVCKGKQLGLLSGNGWSNLRGGQEVLKKWGILSEETCPDVGHEDWNNYSSFNVDKHSEEAAKHKIKSYWFVKNLDELYELIDKNKVVVTGMDWYSGFNQGGGFSFPWIIEKIIGYVVGGHAYAIKGYNRKTNKVLVKAQNSYGSLWGDKGDFWVDADYFVRYAMGRYGAVVNIDIEDVEEPWVKQAEKLYNDIKKRTNYIMRVQNVGEMYLFSEEGLVYIGISIGDGKLKQEFNKYLLDKKVFTPVSEVDFNLISKYLRLKGLRIGKPEDNK